MKAAWWVRVPARRCFTWFRRWTIRTGQTMTSLPPRATNFRTNLLSHGSKTSSILPSLLAFLQNSLHNSKTRYVQVQISRSLTISLQLWGALENEISPSECEIYSYNPDKDPNDDEVTLWVAYFLSLINDLSPQFGPFRSSSSTSVWSASFTFLFVPFLPAALMNSTKKIRSNLTTLQVIISLVKSTPHASSLVEVYWFNTWNIRGSRWKSTFPKIFNKYSDILFSSAARDVKIRFFSTSLQTCLLILHFYRYPFLFRTLK